MTSAGSSSTLSNPTLVPLSSHSSSHFLPHFLPHLVQRRSRQRLLVAHGVDLPLHLLDARLQLRNLARLFRVVTKRRIRNNKAETTRRSQGDYAGRRVRLEVVTDGRLMGVKVSYCKRGRRNSVSPLKGGITAAAASCCLMCSTASNQNSPRPRPHSCPPPHTLPQTFSPTPSPTPSP